MGLFYNYLFHSVYLISTAVSNRAKAKFYDEDLPALEDVSLCGLFMHRV